jgi:hypothetical protein
MEVKDYLDKYKKTTWFTRMLWWCAGADSVLLEKSPMKDRVKYAGIGGIVLCTGLLASFSGGYALYTIVAPKGDAVHDVSIHWSSIIAAGVFGLIWGMIILNLDRFIVSSTGKGDGTDKVTGKEMLGALPRIIIALILGIAISAPLEVRILKSEIDANLQKVQEDYKIELDLQTDSVVNMQIVRYEEKIGAVEVKIKEYDDYVEKRRLELNDQYVKLELEAEGKTGSGKAGRGPAWKDKKENLDRQQADLEKYTVEKAGEVDNMKGDRDKLHEQIDEIDASRAEKKEKNEVVAHQLDGLLKRIQISHEIGGWVPWIILLVLLSIEMGPIFFKMMMSKGVYDYLVENNDRRFKAYSGIIQKEETFQGKDGTIHKEYYEFLEEDQELEEKKMKLERQSDLSKKIVDAWHVKKVKDIKENPGEFYESSDNDKG